MIEIIYTKFGFVGFILLFLCFLALLIVIEKAIQLLFSSSNKNLKKEALLLVQKHQKIKKELLDEIIAIWFLRKETSLKSNLKMLNLIAILSPALGLLGTVFGLIKTFEQITIIKQVEIDVLAHGLAIAMNTTFLGLCIAIFTLFFYHIILIFINKDLKNIEIFLNHKSLEIAGAFKSD